MDEKTDTADTRRGPRATESANRVLKAAAYTADATLDSMVFAPKSMSSAVARRRTIWLKAWHTSYQDKLIVTGCPFQGDCLFGDALDRILMETREEKKAMPRSLKRQDRHPGTFQPFRSQHTLPRCQQDSCRPSWNVNRHSFRKPNNARYPRSIFQ